MRSKCVKGNTAGTNTRDPKIDSMTIMPVWLLALTCSSLIAAYPAASQRTSEELFDRDEEPEAEVSSDLRSKMVKVEGRTGLVLVLGCFSYPDLIECGEEFETMVEVVLPSIVVEDIE